MQRDEFRTLVEQRILFLDGATGTELAKQGMPKGVCPEQWVLENPQSIIDVQRAYCEAGSDIVYACTFGANRRKLEEFGLQDNVVEMNEALARLSREAAGDRLVFGDIAPTGKFVEPFGDLPLEEAIDIYKEQVRGLLAGGVDGFVIETMMDIQEARAALIAVRESCDLPAMVSMTYGEDGRTLTGTDPTAALITLQALGADAVGCNCSTGPEQMLLFVQAMKPYATVPLVAKPNAGMPKLIDGKTVFDMSPDAFASFIPDFVKAGVNLFGGCCGTTPEYIRLTRERGRDLSPQPPLQNAVSAVSSARKTVFLGGGAPLAVIGERINPTGKKKLQAELREGKLTLARQYAAEQTAAGAAILDVNMGVSGIDEKEMMCNAITLLAQTADLPLCIDSTSPDVVEAALRLYPGRALLNSISAEKERIEKTLPLAAKYGAMFVLLPLTDEGIPATCEERMPVVESVFAEAAKHGYHKEDIVLDGLVMTISSAQEAARETLKLVQWGTDTFGVNTTVGLSNVSFGLPQRKWVNASFLAMLIDRGLSTAIANPSSELLMAVKFASDALTTRDHKLMAYVERFANAAAPAASKETQAALPPEEKVYNSVVQGDQDTIGAFVQEALANGITPKDLVDTRLIPAIQNVGERFDRKEYFLPQLMMSADAMKAAFAIIEPLLQKEGTSTRGPVIVLATVKGDIHDIGKNLVALMLKNYGFDVIDLGKDVAAADIVAAAKQHNASLIGLSALMTTTMTEMKEVIELAQQENLSARIMVGGAVVDQAYADEIGAHGYSPDAIGAVRTAEQLSK